MDITDPDIKQMLIQPSHLEPLHRDLSALPELLPLLDENIDGAFDGVGEGVKPYAMGVPPIAVVGEEVACC